MVSAFYFDIDAGAVHLEMLFPVVGWDAEEMLNKIVLMSTLYFFVAFP